MARFGKGLREALFEEPWLCLPSTEAPQEGQAKLWVQEELSLGSFRCVQWTMHRRGWCQRRGRPESQIAALYWHSQI